MPSDGTGAAWDNTIPLDSANVADIPVEIRDLRTGTKLRADKEHVAYAASSAGGEHLNGSAKAYHQNAAPTLRPDGVTALDSTDKGRVWLKATDNSVWIWDGSAWQHSTITALAAISDGLIDKTKMATGFTSGILPLAVVVDQKTAGTDGGTFTTGAWRTRTLNTEVCDNGSILDVTANQIILDAGTYRVEASAPGQQCGSHQVRWYDATNSNTIAYGTTESSPSGSAYQTRSHVAVEFIVASDDTAFELQHQCSTTKSGSGLGLNCNFGGAEVYAQVKIYKLL